MTAKARVPAVEGWFTTDGAKPALLGSRCRSCGTYAFPKEAFACRNPRCASRDFDEVELSRRGRVWSYTDARYQPPPPFVAPSEPYEPPSSSPPKGWSSWARSSPASASPT